MATTTTSKPVVVLRRKAAISQPMQVTPEPQKIAPVASPQPSKVEVKAKPAPAKPAPQKPKAEAKKPTPPPTPRPADGMNTRQRRNRRLREHFLTSPEFRQIADAMMERWPGIFKVEPDQVRPLAIGIMNDLCLAMPEQKPMHLKQALTQWMHEHRFAYWNALVKGGPRYDLNGNPKGEVTPDQQEAAKQQRKAWMQKGKEMRAEMRKKRAEVGQAMTPALRSSATP